MKEKIFKKGLARRLFSVVLALTMAFTLMPMNILPVHAATNPSTWPTTPHTDDCGHPGVEHFYLTGETFQFNYWTCVVGRKFYVSGSYKDYNQNATALDTGSFPDGYTAGWYYSDGSNYRPCTAPLHTHAWQYSVGTGNDANKLTATCTCNSETAGYDSCDYKDKTGNDRKISLTLTASSANYSGSAATITIGTATEKTAWTGAGLTVPTAIAYEKAGGDTLTAAPTAVGSYVAKVSPVGVTATEANTAKVSFTIEDNTFFKVGENGYQWFSQAVEAANTSKQPIVLVKDKKTATEIPANKNVTIDLNGHYMKCSDSNSTIVIQANSTVTITDTNTDAYHYFKYKNNDVWEFVEKPENPESAITVEAINSNTADDTLIKVAGGVITGNGITNKGTLVVDGVNIVGNNLTNTNGGAIKNMKGEVTINKGMLLGNKALRGGAIVNDAGKLTIGTEGGNNKNILIAYNNAIDKNPDAEAYGGAIYSYNDGKVTGKQAVVTLNSGEIKYNECERGAGVCGAVIDDTLVSKIIIPSKSTIIISNNKASNGGGGIMLRWGATLEMNAGTITNNSAVKWSGGLDIGDKSKATITGGTIANNSSEQKGGGISVRDNGQLAMSGGSVRNNTAGVAGGGVHFAEKDKVEHGVTFSGSAVVKDNTSGADGSKVTDNVYIGATKKITLGTFGNNGDIGVTLGTTDGRGQFIEGTVTNLAQLSNYHSDKGDLMVDLKEQKGMIVDATHAWQYSENGNQLVAKCKGKAGGCKFDTCGYDKDATAVKLTLTANDATYSGNAVTAEYAEGEAANWKAAHGKDAPAISYEKKGSDNNWTALEAATEKVGEYRAVAKLTVGTDDYTVYKTFKINEADKTALNEAITAAKAAKAAIVTESSVLETLNNAITDAEEVADNKNVTASDIASAKSAMDKAAANATADLIDEIGEVTYSKDSRDKIKSAAAAYAALTADQKALVDESDVDALEAAESRYKELEAIANSKFLVQAEAGKTALALDWNEVGGAVKYKVYLARCGKRYKLVKTTKGTEFVKSGLKKGKTYKVYVKAYNSKGKKIATTPTAHIITLGGNRSNATKITAVPFMELVKGKTKSVEAKIVSKDGSKTLLSKGHVSKIRYYSSNKSVATVSSSGKVKAVKAGTAYIKAVAPSGVSSVTVVTVTGNVK